MKAGIPNVTLIETSIAARYRAEDMVNKSYFSHYDPNGFHPNYYFTKLGGLCAMDENLGYYYYSALIV